MFGYCLKAIRDTIFQYVVCNQGSGRVKHVGQGKDSNVLVRVASNRRVTFKILSMIFDGVQSK